MECYANGENKEKAKARMYKYNHTKEGRAVRAEYRKRNLLRTREYIREYMRKRAIKAKEQGVCVICLKPKGEDGTISFCGFHKEVIRRNAKKRRKE